MKVKEIMGEGKFILVVVTFLVNVSNYALNLLLARWLGPVFFAEANLYATMVLFLSFIAVALQMTVAKIVAEQRNDQLLVLHRGLMKLSAILVIFLLLLAYPISVFLKLSSVWPLVVLILSSPFYFLMCFDRGRFQGAVQFAELGYTFLCEMLVRLLVTVGFVLMFPLSLSGFAVVIGFAASFIVTHLMLRFEIDVSVKSSMQESNWVIFMKTILLYELSQILINNGDVVLVNNLFSAEQAGLYAAIALLGKTIFFATSIVITILFPKVIELKRQGKNHKILFWKAFGVVSVIGVSIVLGFALFGDQVMSLAFGEHYSSGSLYLWQYALMTCLFSCCNVFVYYHMTLQSYVPVFVSASVGVIQIGLIMFYGKTLSSVIGVQIVMMVVLLVVLLFCHFVLTMSESRKIAGASLTV